jgi:hypothetical protein
MKFQLKSTKYIKQEDFVKEIELPEAPVYYSCGQGRYLGVFPQFTTWDESNPTAIWEYKYVWVDDYIGDLKIEAGFIRLSEFSQIYGFPQHNQKNFRVLEWILNEPNLSCDTFNSILNGIVEKIKNYHVQ